MLYADKDDDDNAVWCGDKGKKVDNDGRPLDRK